MTRRQIDQSREIRLWIGQILIPAVGIALAFPEVREKAKEKILYTRDKVKDLFKKGKSKKEPQVVYVYQPVDTQVFQDLKNKYKQSGSPSDSPLYFSQVMLT